MKIALNFESERLILKKVKMSDWQTLLKTVTSINFPSRLPLAQLTTKDKAQDWIKCRIQDWESDTNFVWSITHKDLNLTIGQISLFPRGTDLALAYWLDPDYWASGYTTEACTALIKHIVENGYRGQLWAGSATWNDASSAILLKLGFHLIGTNTHKLANDIIEQINEYSLDV